MIIPTTLNVLWGLNEIIHIIQTLTCNTHPTKGFPGGSVVNNLPANAGDTGDMDLIPGVGRSPGRGNDNPLQYSCLENPMDRAAWRARVLQGHKESDTTYWWAPTHNNWLLSFYTHFSFLPLEVPKGNCTLHISVSPPEPTVRLPAPHCHWSEGQSPYLALSKCCCLDSIWILLKSTLDIVKIICREPLEKSVNSCYSDQLGQDWRFETFL